MSHLVELFYSAHCFGSPEARALVQRLAAGRPDIVVVEHSVDADPQLARAYHLIATPALVIDRHIVMYGVPRPETLTARIDASIPEGTPPTPACGP